MTYVYREDGEIVTRGGVKQKRPPGTPLPCLGCAKIPPGADPHPASAVELTPENRKCWQHYQRAKAVNWNVPEAADEMVQRHAAMIDEVTRAVEKKQGNGTLVEIGLALGRLAARGG